jgi:Ca-activated chloride channel homolog
MPEFLHPNWLWALALTPTLWWWRARAEANLSVRRQSAASLFRIAACAALIVALAAPLVHTDTQHTDVVFVLDSSRSVSGATSERARNIVNAAIDDKHPDQRIGVVSFGADAAVEATLRSEIAPLDELSIAVDREGTHIQRALELGISRFDSTRARRIVLLTDGHETAGRATSAARAAAAAGVELMTMALLAATTDAVAAEALSAPDAVQRGEPFTVNATIRATSAQPVQILLLRDGEIIASREQRLNIGVHVVSFSDELSRTGLFEYEVVVNSTADGMPENNRIQRFVNVAGPPRVLHVLSDPNSAQALTAALDAQGIDVVEVSAGAVPGVLHRLTEFSLIILNNVSAFELSLAKMTLLEEYVRNSGGGLIAIGGDRSYSAGGYQGTPLEKLLPVTMDIPAEIKIPSLVVTVLIDRSGSMSATAQGQEKLTIAKNAAFAAIEVLNPLDRLGVLAFDNSHEWIVPPTEASHKQAIATRLRQLTAGGGTNLLAALREAGTVMRDQAAKLKHVIVLSDGLSDSEGDSSGAFDEQVRGLVKDRITVSTVAFGGDANQPFMARLADLGKGRFYFTDDPNNVPRIFTSETVVVSRGLVVEKQARLKLASPNEMLAGLRASDIPPLHGYLRVYGKPAAQTLLTGPENDPLLAAWQYGSGRTVAYASDFSNRWGRDWIAWKQFPAFAAQMARWTMRRQTHTLLQPRLRTEGPTRRFELEVWDRDESFINGLNLVAHVQGPKANASTHVMRQAAPGRYALDLPNAVPGRYYVSVKREASATDVVEENVLGDARTFGLSIPYSREFLHRGTNHAALQAITAAARGIQVELTRDAIATILAPPTEAAFRPRTLWWPFVIVALVLIVAETITRRVPLPERWRRRRPENGKTLANEDSVAHIGRLQAQLEHSRAQHLQALNEASNYRAEDLSARARLYTPRRAVKR